MLCYVEYLKKKKYFRLRKAKQKDCERDPAKEVFTTEKCKVHHDSRPWKWEQNTRHRIWHVQVNTGNNISVKNWIYSSHMLEDNSDTSAFCIFINTA